MGLEYLIRPFLDIRKFIGTLDNSEGLFGTAENLTGLFRTLENLMGNFLDIRKFIGTLAKFPFNIAAFEFCMRPLGLVLLLDRLHKIRVKIKPRLMNKCEIYL